VRITGYRPEQTADVARLLDAVNAELR